MNDLMTMIDRIEGLPAPLSAMFKRGAALWFGIETFEDIERVFMQGAGLSPNTYKGYMVGVRQFYDYTGGLHPLQCTPADIELFYDHISKTVNRNTAYQRIAGLKKFFKGVEKVTPFYESPFKVMGEKLNKKLSRTDSGKTKKALSKTELNDLLTWLKKDTSIKGIQNHAIILFLVTTGLRSFEFEQLRWKNLENFEGKYYVEYIGKGDKHGRTEVPSFTAAVIIEAYTAQFNRAPIKNPDDYIFNSLAGFKGRRSPLRKEALYHRLREIYDRAKEAGIIARELTFSAHLFRRTFATLLVKAGMDLKSVQLLTRHANIDTLMKHYVDTGEPAEPFLSRILEAANL